MGRTLAEKALARASGGSPVVPGEIVEVYPDLVMSHTATWRCIAALKQLGVDQLFDKDRIAIVMDHISPARSAKTARDQQICREFATSRGIEKFYDVDSGIAHVVLMENGHVKPGDVIIGTDSHSTIYGSLGALGTGVGFSEITAVWVTGKLWMKVPESIRVDLTGALPTGVYSKDLMLRLVGDLTVDGATYCSVEFGGPAIAGLTISDRMTMTNLAMEMGAKFGVVPADEVTYAYLDAFGMELPDPDDLQPDQDAGYARSVGVDLDALEPLVAAPDTVDNVKPLRELAGTHVDQVFIGSCANAKYEDLVEAAGILEGRKVASSVRLIITPASRRVMKQAADERLLGVFLEAGALITNPGCGACAGDGGSMADGEVTFSTANRNYRGRMGSYDSGIFLGSPAAAAATAIRGVITDPRDLLN